MWIKFKCVIFCGTNLSVQNISMLNKFKCIKYLNVEQIQMCKIFKCGTNFNVKKKIKCGTHTECPAKKEAIRKTQFKNYNQLELAD